VLIDVATDGVPGSVRVRRVEPCRAAPATWSHHLDPETLAGLATALYGPVPPMALVSIAGRSFAEGYGLSAAVERALPRSSRWSPGPVSTQNGCFQHLDSLSIVMPWSG
jgi:hypothetical protein